MTRDVLLIFSGSLLFQIVQVAAYPILLVQLLLARGYETATAGSIVALSWFAILLVSPFVPRIIRRSGYAITTLTSMLISLLAIVILIVGVDLVWAVVSALLMGIALILRWINCDTLICDVVAERSRGSAIGFHEALMGLGIGLGPLLFAFGDTGEAALICIALLVCGQLALFPACVGITVGSESGGDGADISLFAIIPVALAGAFLAGSIENSSIALLPRHFELAGYPLATSALFISAFGFGGTILQPPLGWLADRTSYVFSQATCVAFVILPCLFLNNPDAGQSVIFVAIFLLGAAAGGFNTLAVIEAGKKLPIARMPMAMTAVAVGYTLGSMVGPFVSGRVITLVQNTGMIWLYVVGAVLFGILLFALRRSGT